LLTFRDALLHRLATMRAKRMNKPYDVVLHGILKEEYQVNDG